LKYFFSFPQQNQLIAVFSGFGLLPRQQATKAAATICTAAPYQNSPECALYQNTAERCVSLK